MAPVSHVHTYTRTGYIHTRLTLTLTHTLYYAMSITSFSLLENCTNSNRHQKIKLNSQLTPIKANSNSYQHLSNSIREGIESCTPFGTNNPTFLQCPPPTSHNQYKGLWAHLVARGGQRRTSSERRLYHPDPSALPLSTFERCQFPPQPPFSHKF